MDRIGLIRTQSDLSQKNLNSYPTHLFSGHIRSRRVRSDGHPKLRTIRKQVSCT
jgi:hypothetical protein